MDNSEVFEWLVRYHIEYNLPICKGRISADGVVMPTEGVRPEGAENRWTKGFLVLEDGSKLEQQLEKEGIILDRCPPQFRDISGYDDFVNFLADTKDLDGAFVYDGHGKRAAQISTFTNNSKAIRGIRRIQPSLIPPDFVFSGRTEPLSDREFDDYIGTKTNAAMTLPAAYSRSSLLDMMGKVILGKEAREVHANQIKNSAYGHLGMGKVTRFGANGLEQEFFLEYAPAIFDEQAMAELDGIPSNNDGLYVDREHKIVGILRMYKNDGQGVYKVSEELAYIHEGKMYAAPLPAPRIAVAMPREDTLEQAAGVVPSCA